MDEGEIRMLAELDTLKTEILAMEVKVFGMKAENDRCKCVGTYPTYTQSDFMDVSRELILMANRIRTEI